MCNSKPPIEIFQDVLIICVAISVIILFGFLFNDKWSWALYISSILVVLLTILCVVCNRSSLTSLTSLTSYASIDSDQEDNDLLTSPSPMA